MNRGMLGAGELCVTFHNYNTQWEDKLERHILTRRANFCPRRQVRQKQRSTLNLTEFYCRIFSHN